MWWFWNDPIHFATAMWRVLYEAGIGGLSLPLFQS